MTKKKKEKQKKLEDENFIPKAFQKKENGKDNVLENSKSKNKNQRRQKNRKNEMTNKKSKENDQEPKKKKITKKKIFLIIVLIIILIFAIWLGISTHIWKTMASEMVKNENSIVVDTDGKELAKLGSERKQIKVTLSEIPSDIKNAYIAIEAERYYSHGGIDVKRTAAAIGSYIIHFGSSSYGGSTITQQLVKNLTGDSTDNIGRKVSEWWKASQLETCLSKDEILEAYLNVIYVGPNMYGIGTGAKYYFNKDVKDLSLEECAFLAGINNSPNSYNPFGDSDNTEKISKRVKTVLAKMLELKYIDENSYNTAISNIDKGLKFKKGTITSSDGVYSYHTDALITEIVNDIKKKYDISETFATNYINMAGLKISSTQDSNVQKQMETESKKSKYILRSDNGEDTSQAAMVIIDHTTGHVIGCTGGLGEKTEARSFNRATQTVRQTGSSIKPLSVLAPGIDKKAITASTIFDDTEQDFADGYHPTDYNGSLGKITVRRAVESSQNIPFVEMMEEIKPKTAMQYLKNMGISTLTEEDNSLVLALGGLQVGISPLQMAGAYATIANDGEYIEPVFYSKICNNSGSTIVEPKQEKRRVFSKEVAYILKEILTQPVCGSNGTATYCKIQGIDVAAKTGTTDGDYDRWLCGFTPYYTAVTWFGFDQNETVKYNNKNPAGLIWANVMSRIHTGKQGATFEKPYAITQATICAKTGQKARSGCTDTYTEYFLWFTVPGLCAEHSGEEVNSSNNIDFGNNLNNKVNEIVQGITNDIDGVERPNAGNITNSTQNSDTTNKITNNNSTNKTNTSVTNTTTTNTIPTNTATNVVTNIDKTNTNISNPPSTTNNNVTKQNLTETE